MIQSQIKRAHVRLTSKVSRTFLYSLQNATVLLSAALLSFRSRVRWLSK